jgi:argininosuccinate lyase (EC 4.3.2.1)
MLYRKWGTEKDPVLWYTSSYQDDTEILEQVKLVMKAHVVELFLSVTYRERPAGSSFTG